MNYALTRLICSYRENQGRAASNYGTWLHHNIERHFNNLVRMRALIQLFLTYNYSQEMSPKLKEMSMFLEFERIHIIGREIRPIRTEWRIAAKDELIGGTVDFVGQKKDGTFVLMDWKSTKDLKSKMTNSYGIKAKLVYFFVS